MPNHYFKNTNLIVPFSSVNSVWISSDNTTITITCLNSSYNLKAQAKEDFLSQYTAWLDSQSTPQL